MTDTMTETTTAATPKLLVRRVKFTMSTHPNADTLSLAKIDHTQWQCVLRTADWTSQPTDWEGKREGLYIDLDALLDPARPEFAFLANKATKKFEDGRPGHRVRTVRLRSMISQGMLIPIPAWAEGMTLEQIQAELKIERYEPPIPMEMRGEMIRNPASFIRYTGIENAKNYEKPLMDEEGIRVTEKIHGTNFRVGFAYDGKDEPDYFVGSHNTAKKPDGATLYPVMARKYFKREWLEELAKQDGKWRFTEHFIIFGEIYGSKVQDLNYGCAPGEKQVRLFDVVIDHEFQPFEVVQAVAAFFNVETVPVLYRGPYSEEAVRTLIGGQSTLPKATHVREGIVVTAEPEGRVVDDRGTEHRRMFKFISDDYATRSGEKDGH